MNTLKSIFLFILAGTLSTACSKVKYKKTHGGMAYQLYSGKDTQQIRAGDFIKLSLTQKVNDSIYFTTEDLLPQYQQVGDQAQPYDISEIWTSLHVGDSVVTTQLIDTFMKRNPQGINPSLKKGDKIMSYIKIIRKFSSDSATRKDYDGEVAALKDKQNAQIEKYLADKKITARKVGSGVYVETITPGTGNTIDSGKYVTVNYTGTSWSGLKFDSNTDPKFGRLQPLPVTTGSGGSIKGFEEGIASLKLGEKARLYIPSLLAYGPQPNPGSGIKPFENLIFDIEVLTISAKAPPAEPMPPAPTVQEMSPKPSGK